MTAALQESEGTDGNKGLYSVFAIRDYYMYNTAIIIWYT